MTFLNFQAEDRAHRVGQQDSVYVQYLLAKNTADDVIWRMVQSKLDILGQVSKIGFYIKFTVLVKAVYL